MDVGNGLIAASVAGDGALLVAGMPHASVGYAVVDTAPSFDDERRGDVAAVRRYRFALANDHGRALGLRPAGGWAIEDQSLSGGAVPRQRLRSGPLRAAVVTVAPMGPAGPLPCVIQRWRLDHAGDQVVELEWSGQVRLDRAALTQLTEGGPLPAIVGAPRVTAVDGGVVVERRGVDLAAAILGPGGQVHWSATDEATGTYRLHTTVSLPSSTVYEVGIVVALGATPAQALRTARAGAAVDVEAQATARVAQSRARLRAVPATLDLGLRRLVTRALVYATDCCIAPHGDGVCIMTDHRILPLSWTRDGYYVARMLLQLMPDDGVALVGRHLRWLFGGCEHIAGGFARSYLPNGRVKDSAFQLDQQCYPLLELADYAGHRGDGAVTADLATGVAAVLSAVDARRTPSTGLYTTDETPGDDPLDLPFHFSSHVLLWHTLRRTAALDVPGVDSDALRDLADEVRAATLAAFTFEHAGVRRFAYAVDGHGGRLDYHDANDLPTALAPVWGFCEADDPAWRATMAHAFSAANDGGWYPGSYGGLGSVHTPGAWPLGDVQEYLYARLIGDDVRMRRVTDRLVRTAGHDGALPEARDPASGSVRSRHWFAWPGAALTLALLDPEWTPTPT